MRKLMIIVIVFMMVGVGFLSGCSENKTTNLIVKINGPSSGLVNEVLTYNASVQGGTKPYTYAWDLDNDGLYDDSNKDTAIFTTIYGGTHMINLRITDKNGNQKKANTTLILPLTEPNIVFKDVAFSPSNPVEKDNILFNVIIENTGDKNTSIVLGLNFTHRDSFRLYEQGDKFTLEGHSQKNVTLFTGKNTTDEGILSFGIYYFDFQELKDVTLKILNIEIAVGSPEIYLATTTSNVEGSGKYNEKTTFNAGETVYVYYEFRDVTHENLTDVRISVDVHHKDTWVNYYQYNDELKQISESTSWLMYHSFTTYDNSSVNWPLGIYQVNIGIQDITSGLNTTKTIYFTIT